MTQTAESLLREIGFAVIHFREVYRRWCREHGLSYHELLIFYTLRDLGECTQKTICDFYALPKQTVHNRVRSLQSRGLLTLRQQDGNRRERLLQLTGKGKLYSETFMKPLLEGELAAAEKTGRGKLRQTTRLLELYNKNLDTALNVPEKGRGV